MSDQKRNIADLNRNPYNFVSLAKDGPWLESPDPQRGKHQGHDRWRPELLHGSLTFTLVAQTPVFVPEGFPLRPGASNSPLSPGNLRDLPRRFCRMHKRAADGSVEERFAIPGSALKGMLRSMVEAVTQDRFGVADEAHWLKIPYRRRGFQVGKLERTEDGGWQIRPYHVPKNGPVDPAREMFLFAKRSRARLPRALKNWGKGYKPDALPIPKSVEHIYREGLRHPHYKASFEFAQEQEKSLREAEIQGRLAELDRAVAAWEESGRAKEKEAAMFAARASLEEDDKCWCAESLASFDEAIKDLANLREGAEVHYCNLDPPDRSVGSFGRNAHYLWPSPFAPADLAKDFLPSDELSLLSPLGMSERIFGFASKHTKSSHPFRGKVRLETGWGPALDACTPVAMQLGPLTSPQSPGKSRQMYLEPRDGQSGSYSDGAAARPRGRKFYWKQWSPHPGALEEAHKLSLEDNNQSQLPPPLLAVPAGTRFECRLSFENLCPAELGAIVFVLQGMFEPERHAIQIGKAKPRGLGTCTVENPSVTLERPEQLYAGLSNRVNASLPAAPASNFVPAFQNWCATRGAKPFLQLEHIQDFIALHWMPQAEMICYYPGVKHFRWTPQKNREPDDPADLRPEAMELARKLDEAWCVGNGRQRHRRADIVRIKQVQSDIRGRSRYAAKRFHSASAAGDLRWKSYVGN